MKIYLLLVAIALLALNACKAHAASGRFTITSATFSPGSQTLSGGRFSLRAAVGQHDAGSLRGGNYAIAGGFLNGLSVQQSPGAPLLKIQLTGRGHAILSWPVEAEGWLLEETTALNYGKWQTVMTAVSDTATEHTVTVPATGVMKCYRLKQP